MSLLDGGLANVFGAAFAALYSPATLVKSAETDDGSGGFTVEAASYPVLAMVEATSAEARAASGLPASAVTISVLRAGMPVPVDLDDGLTIAGGAYRVIRVGSDPAGVAFAVVGVPS